ncbi:hypothetical protein ACIBCD_11055 [Nocardia brasiliensis]|uniref:hypothetical protein n=1 Tax=Nocardia brasiliensis TaxID=37326 RepID=UPI00379A9CCF
MSMAEDAARRRRELDRVARDTDEAGREFWRALAEQADEFSNTVTTTGVRTNWEYPKGLFRSEYGWRVPLGYPYELRVKADGGWEILQPAVGEGGESKMGSKTKGLLRAPIPSTFASLPALGDIRKVLVDFIASRS